MPKSQTFPAQRIKSMLDDLGISQSEAANHMSISASTLCRVLTGRQAISIDMAKRFSVYCGLCPLELMAEQAAYELGCLAAGDYENIKPLSELHER